MLARLIAWLVLLAETTIMGRSAVAIVVLFVQVPAVAQLAGVEASTSLSRAGPVALPMLWALTLVISGLLMAASYASHDPGDQRVLEIAACFLLVAGCVVYSLAVWDTAGAVGALWLLAIVGALAVNALGRALLLLLQVLVVQTRTRHTEDRRR